MGGCCSSDKKNVQDPTRAPVQGRVPQPSQDPKGQSTIPNSNIIQGQPVYQNGGSQAINIDPAQKTFVIQPVPVENKNPKTEGSMKISGLAESNGQILAQQNSFGRQGSSVEAGYFNIRLANCYFFGIERTQQGDYTQIVKFDPNIQSMTSYVPPSNMEIYNFCFALYFSEAAIYVSGGLKDETTITNRIFQYNATNNTALELPQFQVRRYAHMSNALNDHVYLIGGIGENHQHLKSCEKFNLKTNTWSTVAELNVVRAFGTSIVYNNEIYVLGGTTGGDQDLAPERKSVTTNLTEIDNALIDPRKCRHSKKIEKYDEIRNSWTVISLKLPIGIDHTFVCSLDKDELQIIGGQTSRGVLQSNLVLNLRDETYTIKRFMSRERVAHRGLVTEKSVWVFGGDPEDTIEEYDILRDEWQQGVSVHKNLIGDIQTYGYSVAPLYVRSSGTGIKFDYGEIKSAPEDKRCFLFGDDLTSIIFEINFTQNFIKDKAVPVGLGLLGYQGITKLPDGKYFFNGGMDHTKTLISNNTYLYNPDQNKAEKLTKSAFARYTFNVIAKGDYVYALGGRTYGDDDVAILRVCERYSLGQQQWERIADLNQGRCSAMTFEHKGSIYIAGGYAGDKMRSASIERYDEAKNVWDLLSVQLKVNVPFTMNVDGREISGVETSGIEASCVIKASKNVNEAEFYFIGGRTENEDMDKVWQFNVEQGNLFESGSLEDRKSLHKVFEYESGKVCIFGGEAKLVEFYDLKNSAIVQEEFSQKIESKINRAAFITGRLESRLIRQGLA